MKKIIKVALAFILTVVFICALAGCNKQVFDFENRFEYAIVSFPDGTCEKIEIEKWSDYDGEQIQIIAKDGTVYLVSSFNCVLVRES